MCFAGINLCLARNNMSQLWFPGCLLHVVTKLATFLLAVLGPCPVPGSELAPYSLSSSILQCLVPLENQGYSLRLPMKLPSRVL